MSIIGQMLKKRSSTLSNREFAGWLTGEVRSASGVQVTPDTAMRSTAVYGSVRILAETVASLPLFLYKRIGKAKEKAPEHPLYSLLHDLPNPEMTSFELREMLMGHLALRGNAYCYLVRDDFGIQVKEIWPLRPDRIEIIRSDDQRLVYIYRLPNGESRVLREEDVWHIRGFGNDGVKGMSPISFAREAIGLSLATEEFGARFFGNGSQLGGVLQTEGQLSREAQERLKEQWEKLHTGLSNAHRVAILEEGLKWQQVGIAPEDGQFLETRKFQVAEIARIFRVPPHMLADLDRATFSNIEHQSIEFVVHTIRPWLVRWEQSIKRDLLLPSERDTYFAEFLVDGLLRGDIKSRYEAYAVGRQNGWLSANDIRQMENMNPLPDGQGEQYLIPLNMIPADQVTSQSSEEDARSIETRSLTREERSLKSAAKRRQIAQSFLSVFEDAAARIVRREKNDVLAAAKKHLSKRSVETFETWLEDFYREHEEFVERNIAPAHESLAQAIYTETADELGIDNEMTDTMRSFLAAYTTAYIARHINSSLGQLKSLIKEKKSEDEILSALEQRLSEWEEKRAKKIARWETVRESNAIVHEAYRQKGISKVRWNTFGKSCPYCRNLDGKIVGIDEAFVSAGTEYQPEGAESALVNDHDCLHAPLHEGCDCTISIA